MVRPGPAAPGRHHAGRARWRVVLLLALLVLGTGGSLLPTPAAAQAGGPVLELFWADGCPHCEAELTWLPTLQDEVPDLDVRTYEITGSAPNRALLQQRADELGFDARAVPVTIVAERVWIGFNDVVAVEVAEVVRSGGSAPATDAAIVEVPLVGRVDVGATSLIAATALIGALDGVNPCSLWVLTLLLALVLHTGSRRRVFAVGAVFLTVTAGMYALYVGGLYGVLTFLAYEDWIRVSLAVVAAIFGLVAVKDFFWFHTGPSLSIPDRHKPGIYRRMRRVAAADRPLPTVLGGTAMMAIGVSLVETPCTAGFPLVWSNLLASQGVDGAAAAGLFALYMLLFLLDEAVVFTVAVGTMRMAKLQERHGRLLKLVSGVVMLALAGTMLLAPHLLEQITGTVLVFGSAALVTVLVVLLHGRWRARVAESPRARRPHTM